MSALHECAQLIRQGIRPSEIARRRKTSVKTVLGYIDELIGRGDIRRSDVAFTISASTRQAIAALVSRGHSQMPLRLQRTLKGEGHDIEVEDIETAMRYGTASGFLGEMYEDIRAIEVGLHRAVRQALEEEYGKGELDWWRKGVPEAIRASCQMKREQDLDPVPDPYNYTDLMELREIVTRNWDVVRRKLPAHIGADRKELAADLTRLNSIRRIVMHPVRTTAPSEEEFQMVRALRRRLGHVPIS